MKFEVDHLHKGVSYQDYAAQEGLRASDLHVLRRSPAHWRIYKETPQEETESLMFGKIFHMAIERPEWFMDSYKVKPKVDRRTTAGKETIKAFMAEHEPLEKLGQIVILENDWVEPLTGMLRAAVKHRLLGNLIKKGVRETSVWTADPETGLLLQIRIDYLSERSIMVDFKTTRDARREFFYHQIFSARYDNSPFYILSAAHYTHVARLSKVCRGDSMTFVAIEKEAPYGILIYPMDEGCLDVGERWRAHLTKQFAECKVKNEWPCYEERAVAVEPPQYADLPPVWGDL